MKTKYKFIEFNRIGVNETQWGCDNRKSGQRLGWVDWDRQWKQYIFWMDEHAIFSHDCLTDIAHFLQQLNEEKTRISDEVDN